MSTEDFFKKQTASSRIKASIVAEYFPQYCKILLKRPQSKIRYLDLFSGPGLYEDGSLSTPLLIAKSCAEDKNLSQKVQLIFNDKNYCEELRANYFKHFSTNSFQFEPRFGDKTVGEHEGITEYLTKEPKKPNPHPTLLFFDPFGYKGIDTLVLAKFMENWGNEIFLFVNIKRIHAATENDKFDALMKSLFPTSINQIKRDRKYKASVQERLSLIIENLASEFQKSIGSSLYHCAFKFQEEDSKTTSHYILHLTKHKKGFELVKQVYFGFDNIGAVLQGDGNYTFDSKIMEAPNNQLDFGDQNVLVLADKLLKKYKGQTITAKALFDDHHPSTDYCWTHYAKTLRYLAEEEKIKATFTDNKTHRVRVLPSNTCKLEF